MTRPTRTPVSPECAAARLQLALDEVQKVTAGFSAFLSNHAIPDSVAVSLALRSRSLLQEASQHLDAAVLRLEGNT